MVSLYTETHFSLQSALVSDISLIWAPSITCPNPLCPWAFSVPGPTGLDELKPTCCVFLVHSFLYVSQSNKTAKALFTMEQNWAQATEGGERERGNLPKEAHWRLGAQHFIFLGFQTFNHCSYGQSWAQRATVESWPETEERIRALLDKRTLLQLLNKPANRPAAICHYCSHVIKC